MYFTGEAQRQTVIRLQAALVEGGWLGLSAAEASAELLRPLEAVSFPGTVLFRKRSQRRTLAPPRPNAPADFRPPTVRRPPRVEPGPMVERLRMPETPLELAQAEADRGRLDHARELCRDAIRGNRLDPEAHLLLAAIEQERGDLAAALDAVRSAIYLAPESPSAHFLLGSLLLRHGEAGKARRSMQTVVELLASVPSDQVVAGAAGLPAGRLLETAAAHLEAM
jgi:chemotaxis protein methyltransferase CheR